MTGAEWCVVEPLMTGRRGWTATAATRRSAVGKIAEVIGYGTAPSDAFRQHLMTSDSRPSVRFGRTWPRLFTFLLTDVNFSLDVGRCDRLIMLIPLFRDIWPGHLEARSVTS